MTDLEELIDDMNEQVNVNIDTIGESRIFKILNFVVPKCFYIWTTSNPREYPTTPRNSQKVIDYCNNILFDDNFL